MASNQPLSIYEKLLRAQTSSTVEDIVNQENSKQIRVHMPAKVVAVHGNTVDVEIQGQEDSGFGYYVSFPQLLDLPIVYNNYTSKAYIITPIQVGDTGLVEFLDFNSSSFNDNGKPLLTGDQFPHSLNNGVFINGYIPTSSVIQLNNIDDYALAIGLHNGTFAISVNNNGGAEFKSITAININTPTLTCSETLVAKDIMVTNGASGSFITKDDKTVTVENGIITNIG